MNTTHTDFLFELNKTELLHVALREQAVSLPRALDKQTIIEILLGHRTRPFPNPVDDYRALAQRSIDTIRKSIRLQLLKQCGQSTCSGINRCPDTMAIVCFLRNHH